MKHLTAPFDPAELKALHAGENILVSGIIYTARDAAHARLCAALEKGEELPVDLRGQTVFYAGPTPTPPGKPSGAIGPTTSVRMDPYTPAMLHYGVNALIGKGGRSQSVKDALRETGSVYFAAIGGWGGVVTLLVSILFTGAMLRICLRTFVLRARLTGIVLRPQQPRIPFAKGERALLAVGIVMAALLYAMDIFAMLTM